MGDERERERVEERMAVWAFVWLASWGASSLEWGIIKKHLPSYRVRRLSGHSGITGLVFLDALRQYNTFE